MGVLMSIPYERNDATVYDIREVNSSFASGTLKVMYLGNNRNGSHFSKNAVEKALPSLKNVPIVCHWDEEAGEIGGHDVAVVSDDNGSLRLKNLTEPCGVVPDHAQFCFQKDTDDDGEEHEYLIIKNVLLWKRQDVYRHITNELAGRVKHSMEITVNDSCTTKDGLYDIKDFEFTALCLLENCEPCFQGSELELYTAQNFKKKMEQMMLEMKECFSTVTPSQEDDNIQPPKDKKEGGENVLKDKLDLIVKYGVTADSLNFSIEDIPIDELEEKLKAFKIDMSNTSLDENGNKDSKITEKYAIESNVRQELMRIVETEKIQKEWGECTRYWFVDYDKDVQQVYCWDTTDWLLYGFTYKIDGDAITIDYSCKKRKKYEIIDFDEGEQVSPFADVFTMMEGKIRSNIDFENKFQEASKTITSMEAELGELRQFKIDTETAAANDERDKIFAQFEDLTGIDAFENLKDDAMKYDIATLEEKCFAIRGRNAIAKFSNESPKAPKLKVEKTDMTKEPYGGLFQQYGIEPND